jgi:hypothetical protein
MNSVGHSVLSWRVVSKNDIFIFLFLCLRLRAPVIKNNGEMPVLESVGG